MGAPLPRGPCCTPPGPGVIWALPGLRLVLSSLLALITGQALNSSWQQALPLIWEVMNLMSPPIDGMASDKLSQSPPGEHCHSHTLHLTLQPSQLLLSFFLESACEKNLQDFVVLTIFTYIFTSAVCLTQCRLDFWTYFPIVFILLITGQSITTLIIYTPICCGDVGVISSVL